MAGDQPSAAPLKDRGNDLYETPEVATEALLRVEQLPPYIWEPACGPGAIARVLRRHGHKVLATDLVDYDSPEQNERWDFLMERNTPADVQAIVTNPPFKNALDFVSHGLTLVPKVILLLRLAFLEGGNMESKRDRSRLRGEILDGGSLARVHVFRNRLPMMHRDGQGIVEAEKTTGNAIAFAWYVWDRNHKGPTELHRLSWVDQ